MDIENLPKEERKVVYLLLQLGVPSSQYPPSTKHISASKRAADQLGIKIIRIKITVGSSSALERYVFRFPGYKRNDDVANRIAESIIYAANVTFGPLGDPHESRLILPVPSTLLKNANEIALDTLIELEDKRSQSLRTLGFPGLSIGFTTQLLDAYVTAAWKITPLIYNNPNFLNAARFLKESQDNFTVWPGQINEVIHDTSAHFETGWEQSRLEIALLNAFKVVEALIGDLPSDDRKLIRKIKNIGINPYDEFGIDPKLPLYEFIRDMNKSRDKTSAHGSTPPKKILVRDLLLYQDCASFMLAEALEKSLGENLYAK